MAHGEMHTQPQSDRSAITLLYVARGLRGFGDGFAIIVLPAYLSFIGFSPVEIGAVASAALFGTAMFTLAIGFIAPRHDLRNLLIAGALLMVATGLAFSNAAQFAIVAMIAFAGTINPSTGDLGVLVPLEHAMLAHGAPDDERTRNFARYSLIGALSMAAGSIVAAAPDFLSHAGIGMLVSFKIMFYAYAVLGVASAALYRLLPHVRADERPSAPLGPSRGVVYKLAALFSLDAFAGGFVVQSLMALWLFERFHLSLSAASLFFFWTSVLSAFSYPLAARLAKRIGLINTMVFTHIPSSIFLILAALLVESDLHARLSARARGAVANGCADADLLRHGRRNAGRACHRGQRDRGAAQPRRRAQPHACRRFTRHRHFPDCR